MNELMIFDNPEFGTVRTLEEDGAILFCGSDVAKALGYTNPRDALSRHCRGVVKRDAWVQTGEKADGTPATRATEMSFIPESDLYRLIFSSKLPTAEKFTDWVTIEVLPSIRKHGQYVAPQVDATRPLTPDDYLRAASILATCKSDRLKYVIPLIRKAGIEVAAYEGGRNKPRDVTTANLINRACNDYGLSLRGIERASGISATQLSRIRRGESFPSVERAAIIRDAIERLEPACVDGMNTAAEES